MMKSKSKHERKKRAAVRVQRVVKRHFKRCNWMMQSKGWKDCGCKATWHARGIGSYYCTKHRSHVSGWRYDLVPLNDKRSDASDAFAAAHGSSVLSTTYKQSEKK